MVALNDLQKNLLADWEVPSLDLIINCMHCGLCLPHCPTYVETGLERSSPRGRIALMRAITDGKLDIGSKGFLEEMYFCLECLACQTACPAGVQYGHLVEAARTMVDSRTKKSFVSRAFKKTLLNGLLASPTLLNVAAWPLRLYQGLGLRWLLQNSGILKLLPGGIADLDGFLPHLPYRSSKSVIQRITPPVGQRRYRVGYLFGCVMSVMFSDIACATVRVLARNGCEIVAPKEQKCCGALHVHNGEIEKAAELARHNIDVFEKADVNYIVLDSAGCGAFMKEYGDFLKNDPVYAGKAEAFSKKVKDISEFLVDIAPLNKDMAEINRRGTYHDPCHLAHGQGITRQPRDLLKSIPGLEFVELKESTWCCGSAGIYNITHYDFSMKLLARKMNNIANTGANLLLTGNPGCLIQLKLGVKKYGPDIEVLHPVELLDQAYKAYNR